MTIPCFIQSMNEISILKITFHVRKNKSVENLLGLIKTTVNSIVE